MTEQKNIYAALCKMQAALTTVEKGRQAYNFKYADLATIWEMIRRPLTDNGLSVTQLVNTENDKTYLITRLMHISGDAIESKALMEYAPKKVTEFGALITYYRRYMLSAMLGIVSDEDIDDGKEDNTEKKPSIISAEQLAHIESLINGYDDIRQRMVKAFGSIANISVDKYDMIVNSINKLIADKVVK